MTLLDTDVMIEIQRGRPKAEAWLRSAVGDVAVPAPVAWEMPIGSRDKLELAKAARFLNQFDVEEITEQDSALAGSLLHQHCLVSGLSVPDYIVAAQAITRGATLYTFNKKHFGVIAGLRAAAPYER